MGQISRICHQLQQYNANGGQVLCTFLQVSRGYRFACTSWLLTDWSNERRWGTGGDLGGNSRGRAVGVRLHGTV